MDTGNTQSQQTSVMRFGKAPVHAGPWAYAVPQKFTIAAAAAGAMAQRKRIALPTAVIARSQSRS